MRVGKSTLADIEAPFPLSSGGLRGLMEYVSFRLGTPVSALLRTPQVIVMSRFPRARRLETPWCPCQACVCERDYLHL